MDRDLEAAAATALRRAAPALSSRPARPPRAAAAAWPSSAGSPPAVQHLSADGAVEQAGVQIGRPNCPASRRASVPLPDAAGPSTAMIDAAASTGSIVSAPSRASARRSPGSWWRSCAGVVEATGFFGRQAQHQEGHGDAVVEMRGDLAPPPAGAAAVPVDGQAVAALLDARRRRPRGRAAIAARRSLSLTRSSPRPRITSCPRRRPRRRRGSDIRRSSRARAPAGTSTPVSVPSARRVMSPTGSPASLARVRRR